ncbi:MAG: hypothetical protein ABSA67_13420 [Candidatus Brocadiia bacterium]|jgi:hypothetical protein
MMHEKMRRADRGVILIVIVGVLAVLSLLAATFGMIARLELAGSRNQTEHEMAREAAHAGAEYLLNALQSWLNGSSMTSGPVPTFLPNVSDADGILQYKRDGVKVYFAVNSTVPPGSVTPDWLQGLGLADAGMFNLNAMGFASDLGSDVNPDIRYTSFDCSLVRLLKSRFATVTAGDINNPSNTGIDNYRGAVYPAPAVPTFTSALEQQRVAILLSQALMNWRYGPDGVPGTAGTEERRLGHLPRWNSKLGATSINLGIHDAAGNPYPPGGPAWGASSNPNDTLASLLITWAGPGFFPTTYFEPGGPLPVPPAPPTGEWRSYSSTDAKWGNDQGLPVPGLFWGIVALSPPSLPSNTTTIYADKTQQPGWHDWPASIWNNYYVYFATGPDKWQRAQIQTNTANVLTLATPLPNAPNAGDSFCICTPQAYVGLLNQRWVTGDLNEGDLVPNAMAWPNGALATEGNVWDLLVDNDTLLFPGPYGAVANMGTCTALVAPNDNSLYDSTKNGIWTSSAFLNKGYVVHIYGGTGRGQVRTIYDYDSTRNRLVLYNPVTSTPPVTVNPVFWTSGNSPDTTSQYRIEWPDNNLTSKFQPNNLQGDDRLYLSLGSLRDSVIVPAFVSDGLSSANAQAVADILLPYFLPYLSVSTQAIQASQSLCSINDWAVDGVDNDANGVVDDNNNPPAGSAPSSNALTEPQYEWNSPQGTSNRETQLAPRLYNKLGLYTWAHAGAATTSTTTRIQQAAQLVANIIDFRDPPPTATPPAIPPPDVPTKLTISALDPTAALLGVPANTVVYGAKGLHVTQVMPSPDPIYSAIPNGGEMIDNGSGAPTEIPAGDWVWNAAGHWDVLDWTHNVNGLGPRATFTFNNLMPGYYAMRLIGTPSTFTLTYPIGGTAYTVTPAIAEPDNPALSTAFVRKPADAFGFTRLVCFQVVSGGTLSFQLQAPVNSQFWGFALCAQYIQLTNIATHDIRLDALTVATDQTQVATTGPGILPWQAAGMYTRADGGYADLRRIPGAAVGALGFVTDSGGNPAPTLSTATFPINYGTYVICMSEESYEKQWTAQKGDPDYSTTPSTYNPGGLVPPPTINGDGIWGDAPNEAYPIYPFGDLNSDQYTMALLMGVKGSPTAYKPSVAVSYVAGAQIALVAGGPAADGSYVDGAIPVMNVPPHLDATYHNELSCYSSIEKTVILQPTWDTTPQYGPYWAPYVTAAAGTIPTTSSPQGLAASQNTLVIGQDDSPRTPAGNTFRACLNKNYGYSSSIYVGMIWDPAAVPTWFGAGTPPWPNSSPPVWYTDKRWATLAKPSLLALQYRAFPFILNRPYPTTGWLGLVPTSNTDAVNAATGNPTVLGSWRTIDPNPNPPVAGQVTPPATPEQLLGTLMSNATVGGVYARFNINTAPVDTLKAVFPDATAQAIVFARNARAKGFAPTTYPWYSGVLSPALANASWATWDELLNDPLFQYSATVSGYPPPPPPNVGGIGFYDCHDPVNPLTDLVSNADAGAGTYADGFPDNSNEKKEWFMRYSNLFCLQSTSFQFTVAGLVYADRPWDPVTMQNNEPVAMVRIEVDVDLSTGTPSIVHFRYLTQQ